MEQPLQPSGQTQNAQEKKWYQREIGGVFGLIVLVIVGYWAISSITTIDDVTESISDTAELSNALNEEVIGSDKAESKKPAIDKNIPPVIVTSAALVKDYTDNEVAADAKYKGKLLEVSGKVSGVTNGSFDNEMVVRLSDSEYDFNAPSCSMEESEKEKVLALKKGQAVTLIGIGDSATIGSPVLKECRFK